MGHTKTLIPVEVIEQRILLIRRQKVILDADLAMLYGVPTRVLNQAVRRNLKRFPQDFMFKLSQPEKDRVITICDHLKNLKLICQCSEGSYGERSSVVSLEQL